MNLYYSTETLSWCINDQHTQLKVAANGNLTEVICRTEHVYSYEQLKSLLDLTDQEVIILRLKFGDIPKDHWQLLAEKVAEQRLFLKTVKVTLNNRTDKPGIAATVADYIYGKNTDSIDYKVVDLLTDCWINGQVYDTNNDY